MKKIDQHGFSLIEGVLILLVVAIIGFVGWYIWKNKNKLNNASTPTISSTKNMKTAISAKSSAQSSANDSNPYAGWKTALLQYEKIAYKYPANWKIDDESLPGGCTDPGTDFVYLTSPSDEQVVLRAGVYCTGDDGAIGFAAIPLKSLGQNLYLDLESTSNGTKPLPTQPQLACLSELKDNPTSVFLSSSKNVKSAGPNSSEVPQNGFCYYPFNVQKATTAYPNQTINSIENSADFNTAKLIFESMHY